MSETQIGFDFDTCQVCGVRLNTLANSTLLRSSAGLTPRWMPKEGCTCDADSDCFTGQCADSCRACFATNICQTCGDMGEAS